MLSGCRVSCFTKSASNEQISYQHQLSRLDWLDSLCSPPTAPDVPTCLHFYLFIFALLSFSSLSTLPLVCSAVLKSGSGRWTEPWINQRDQYFPNWLRRSVQTDRHLTALIRPSLGKLLLVVYQLSLAWFGLSPVWSWLCLTCLDFTLKCWRLCEQGPFPIHQTISQK